MYVARPVKLTLLMMLSVAVGLAAERPERYALVLKDAPLAQSLTARKDMGSAAARDRRVALLSAQATVRSAVSQRGARVTGANHFLSNVMFVEATEEQASTLASLPGVDYVEKSQKLYLRLNRALDLMNVPAAWGSVNGEQNAGAGVKIAILDTGIDHTHPAFQDNSLQFPAGFPKCQQPLGDCAYVTRKIIAARSYVAMVAGGEPEFSRPDDVSPRDRVGHGTAVASVAAGVRATGPSGTISGVAPKAWLGNYKVFGSPGVNGRFTFDSVILQALEDALNDGMDIASVSLGAPAVWGPRDSGDTCGKAAGRACDWRADAIENATRLGMTVVVAAGNSGDLATRFPAFTSVETPGTAPSAITVGASTNKHILYQSVRPEGRAVINTLFSDGPKAAVTGVLRDVARLENDGLACEPLSNGSLTGAVALIERGECSNTLKVIYAHRAGAVGVIIYQRQNINGIFPMRGMQETAIPSVLVANRDGLTLKNLAASNVAVTLDPALRAVELTNPIDYDTVAFLSSRGPSIRQMAIKPEVIAVGTDLYMAAQRYDPNGEMYDASGFTAAQGTSFAAPFVAGAAALVKQRNPNFTPASIKSAIVNTASDRIQDYDEQGRVVMARIADSGAGKLDAGAAVRTNVTVEPSTLSFGAVTGTTLPGEILKLNNHSSSRLTLRLEVRARDTDRNASVSLSTSTVNVDPGGAQEVTVRLQGTRPQPGSYEGFVVITGGAVTLRVPYLYLVGDGVPATLIPLEGDAFSAEVNQSVSLSFKVVDRFGVPVQGVATEFRPSAGGGSIEFEDKQTDSLGIAYARVFLGPRHGDQSFFVRAGQLTFEYVGRARLRPSVETGGVLNAASLRAGQGLAPGSYISIFGKSLAEVTKVFNTPYLPLSIAGVSVSFDVPSRNLSVPGRLHFVSDGQINVQIPWELQGANSAIMKVSIGDTSSALVTVPLLDHSPAVFEYTEAATGRLVAAALDANFALIGSSNAARRGSVIQVYANGLGPVDNQPASGEVTPASPLANTRAVPVVTIGGRPAEVLFSGLAPFNVGLYQVNLRVPADAPTGLQPLILTVNGIVSKTANVPIQ